MVLPVEVSRRRSSGWRRVDGSRAVSCPAARRTTKRGPRPAAQRKVAVVPRPAARRAIVVARRRRERNTVPISSAVCVPTSLVSRSIAGADEALQPMAGWAPSKPSVLSRSRQAAPPRAPAIFSLMAAHAARSMDGASQSRPPAPISPPAKSSQSFGLFACCIAAPPTPEAREAATTPPIGPAGGDYTGALDAAGRRCGKGRCARQSGNGLRDARRSCLCRHRERTRVHAANISRAGARLSPKGLSTPARYVRGRAVHVLRRRVGRRRLARRGRAEIRKRRRLRGRVRERRAARDGKNDARGPSGESVHWSVAVLQ